MADEATLLDAPAIEAEPIESTAVDTTDAQPTETGSEGTESTGAELTGPQLWRDIKASTDAQKPLTPSQVKAIRDAIHQQEFAKSKFPDGLNKLDATIKAVSQLSSDPTAPIEQVIQETVQERDYFRELDSLYTSGKADFVEKLAEAEPNAFQQIAPAVFRKFAELNPEGYSAYVSQAVVSHLNAAEVPLQFSILKAFIPQLPEGPAKEQIVQAVEAIYGSFDSLKQLASKPVTKPFTAPTQEAAKPQNGVDPGQDMTRREWNLSVQREGVDMVLTEASRLAGKTPLSEKEKQDVLGKVNEELEARLTANRKYGEAMQGYLKNNNRSAYIQRIQSERKQMIPAATRRAVDDVVAARVKPAAKVADPTKPAAKVNNQHTVDFRRIAGHPKTQGMTVDLNRTPNHMLLKKQAFVKGEEKPVQW